MNMNRLKKIKSQKIYFNVRYGVLFLTLVTVMAFMAAFGDRSYEQRQTFLEQIRLHYLTPPAAVNEPYNLNHTIGSRHEHYDYHQKILEILKKHGIQKNGFFVEAGALDGEYLSHTLDLEHFLGWSGLLVEASPSLVPQLKSKNRKSWIANVCLTAVDNVQVEFLTKAEQDQTWMRGVGRINPHETAINASQPNFASWVRKSEGKVKGFKLATILEAINVQKVDLLVLDVEGYEFKVLQSHPFNDFPIKVIAVEIQWVSEGLDILKDFLAQQGYNMEYKTDADAIFVLK